MPKNILLDADVFVSYLVRDDLFKHSVNVVKQIVAGLVKAYVSSEIYDDSVNA